MKKQEVHSVPTKTVGKQSRVAGTTVRMRQAGCKYTLQGKDKCVEGSCFHIDSPEGLLCLGTATDYAAFICFGLSNSVEFYLKYKYMISL